MTVFVSAYGGASIERFSVPFAAHLLPKVYRGLPVPEVKPLRRL
jgi:hypothetical protein